MPNVHELIRDHVTLSIRCLTQRGIAYEPLDNGIRSTEDATRVQRIADSLDGAKIDAVLRKWLRRLPHVSVR
jgi:hypothetical protein